MMAYSAFNKRRAIDWFRELDESGAPFPRPRALATRLTMDPDRAEGLVAELIAEGAIELYHVEDIEYVSVLMSRDASFPLAQRKQYRGASGTARKAPSGTGSPVPTRITDRAPLPEPVVATPPAPTPSAQPEAVRFERGRKPFISAEIIRAAQEREQPLHEFVTALINIGFAEVGAASKGERA